MTVPIPVAIRQLLACPQCHGPLRDAPAVAGAATDGLICDACRLRFPVRDGIPVMLLDQATPLAP